MVTEQPEPAVMRPVFSPQATAASLTAFLISLATAFLALPHSVLDNAHVNPTVVADLQLISALVIAVTGAHMSVSRSLLPSVDGTKSVQVPAPSTVTIDTPPDRPGPAGGP